MSSKWIKDLEQEFIKLENDPVYWGGISAILERIDEILRRAMYSVDNENLYEEIRKEISNDK